MIDDRPRTLVSAWIALSRPTDVQLLVNPADRAPAHAGPRITGELFTPITLGPRLHVALVTAHTAPGVELDPTALHYYDLRFQTADGTKSLSSDDVINPGTAREHALSYDGDPVGLPSFCMAADASAVSAMHVSCRKPPGPGVDALPIVDQALEKHRDVVRLRPKMLLHTGDQIYADDVSPGWLHWIQRRMLPGLLGLSPAQLLPDAFAGKDHRPGRRSWVRGADTRLSSTHEKSHLVSFAEFACSYLLAWSDTVWPLGGHLPHPGSAAHEHAVEHTTALRGTSGGRDLPYLRAVRRALANVPSYMMFDDHEVTDDWYITRRWREEVLETALGRRIIGNGMLAFCLFQGWGNSPSDYASVAAGSPTTPEAELLQLCRGSLAAGEPEEEFRAGIERLLDLGARPAGWRADPSTMAAPRADNWQVRFHFHVVGPSHELIGIDTRTWRAQSDGRADSPVENISRNGVQAQILDLPPPVPGNRVTLVLMPPPWVMLPALDTLVLFGLDLTRRLGRVLRGQSVEPDLEVDDDLEAQLRDVFEANRDDAEQAITALTVLTSVAGILGMATSVWAPFLNDIREHVTDYFDRRHSRQAEQTLIRRLVDSFAAQARQSRRQGTLSGEAWADLVGNAWFGRNAHRVCDREGPGYNRVGFELFLSGMAERFRRAATPVDRQRVVLFSGDVHFGFTTRLAYRATRSTFTAFEGAHGARSDHPVDMVLVNLVSSAAKNNAGAGGAALHALGMDTEHFNQLLRMGWQHRGPNGTDTTPSPPFRMDTRRTDGLSWRMPVVSRTTLSHGHRAGTNADFTWLQVNLKTPRRELVPGSLQLVGQRRPDWWYRIDVLPSRAGGSVNLADALAPTVREGVPESMHERVLRMLRNTGRAIGGNPGRAVMGDNNVGWMVLVDNGQTVAHALYSSGGRRMTWRAPLATNAADLALPDFGGAS